MSSWHWMYGVKGRDGGFIATSTTERGAKCHATRNRYREVYRWHVHSWVVQLVATKNGKRWKNKQQNFD